MLANESCQWVLDSSYSPIPSLPQYIISKLKPLTGASVLRVSYLKSDNIVAQVQPSALLRLPVELIQDIAESLSLPDVFNLRETCHRLAGVIQLDQRFWYTRFLRKELFGFFFKHDIQDEIREIKSRAILRGLSPSKMDWMQLIKSLAQFSSFTTAGCFHDAPPGFKNRRRVWKILETMEQDSSSCM